MLRTLRSLPLVCLVVVFLSAIPGAGPAHADDRDIRPLLDRIDRLERDLNQIQRQIYRNGVSPGGGAPTPLADTSGDATPALNAEIRMNQLETQMRTLTGQVENAQYGIDQLKARLDKTAADDEVRFQAIEHPDGAAAAPGRTADATAGKVAGPAAHPPTAPAGAGSPDTAPSQSGLLGTIPAGGSGNKAAAEPAAVSAAGTLPNGSPEQQYSYAFGLLRQADYPAAEQALKAFLQKHPNDPLAGNAQYWLGESYFVRNDFPNAAAAFAEGYKLYPQSGKAADNLLKLGISLGNIGRKQDACFSFARLERDFSTMAPAIKDREKAEKQRLGCP